MEIILTIVIAAFLCLMYFLIYDRGIRLCKDGEKHDMRLFAQGERGGMRFGIYQCEKCGYNTHPNDPEMLCRKH